MKDNIIQIIPAPESLFAVYDMGPGSRNITVKVLCLALTDQGNILKLTMDEDTGHVEDARDAKCFRGYRWI